MAAMAAMKESRRRKSQPGFLFIAQDPSNTETVGALGRHGIVLEQRDCWYQLAAAQRAPTRNNNAVAAAVRAYNGCERSADRAGARSSPNEARAVHGCQPTYHACKYRLESSGFS